MKNKSYSNVENLINEISEGSSLTKKEKEEVRKELQSHFYEKAKDLELSNKEQLIENLMIKDFGKKEDISSELFYSKYPYLRIPIIGSVLHFPVLRRALLILILYLGTFMLYPSLILIDYGISSSTGNISYPTSKVVDFLVYLIVFGMPLLIPIIIGINSKLLNISVKDLIKSVLISLIPIFFIHFLLFVISWKSLFGNSIITNLMLYFPMTITQILSGLVIIFSRLIVNLLSKFKFSFLIMDSKKYLKSNFSNCNILLINSIFDIWGFSSK